jgi:hypothetical protein
VQEKRKAMADKIKDHKMVGINLHVFLDKFDELVASIKNSD